MESKCCERSGKAGAPLGGASPMSPYMASRTMSSESCSVTHLAASEKNPMICGRTLLSAESAIATLPDLEEFSALSPPERQARLCVACRYRAHRDWLPSDALQRDPARRRGRSFY